jgi:hypothetical protein
MRHDPTTEAVISSPPLRRFLVSVSRGRHLNCLHSPTDNSSRSVMRSCAPWFVEGSAIAAVCRRVSKNALVLYLHASGCWDKSPIPSSFELTSIYTKGRKFSRLLCLRYCHPGFSDQPWQHSCWVPHLLTWSELLQLSFDTWTGRRIIVTSVALLLRGALER